MSKKIIGVTVGTPISIAKIGNDLKPDIKDYVDEQVGDIETAIDNIAELQESYINGEITDGLLGIELSKVYPIGSLYMSTNDTSPASLFGGTWEQLKDRFLLGAGDTYAAGVTGGSATHSHSHDLWADIYMISESSTEHRDKGIMLMKGKTHEGKPTYFDYYLQDKDSSGKHLLQRVDKTNENAWYKHGTNVDGTIGETSTLPPYLAVYMWKRVA